MFRSGRRARAWACRRSEAVPSRAPTGRSANVAKASLTKASRALLGRKDCDFSFSGLKTAAARLAQTCETDQQRADLADAVQTAIARQLAERSDRALKAYAEEHPHRLFVVAGGVAANRTVRATLQGTAEKNGFAFLAPPMAYCTDNAAMIALAGAERLRKGLVSDIDTAARPRWPLDEYSALNDPTHAPGRKGAKA